MATALDEGSSLILFPEGTRNLTEMPLLPFKSGLYRLALARPGVEMVPVWIANLNRVHAEGRADPGPDHVHGHLRHAGQAARGRGEDRLPRAGARRAPVASAAGASRR